MTSDTLVPVLPGGAALFALLGVAHLATQPAAQGRPVAVVAGALALVLGAARVACSVPRLARWVHSHADEVGLAMSLLGSLYGFAWLLVTRQTAAAGQMILFVVTAAAHLTGGGLDHGYTLTVTVLGHDL